MRKILWFIRRTWGNLFRSSEFWMFLLLLIGYDIYKAILNGGFVKNYTLNDMLSSELGLYGTIGTFILLIGSIFVSCMVSGRTPGIENIVVRINRGIWYRCMVISQITSQLIYFVITQLGLTLFHIIFVGMKINIDETTLLYFKHIFMFVLLGVTFSMVVMLSGLMAHHFVNGIGPLLTLSFVIFDVFFYRKFDPSYANGDMYGMLTEFSQSYDRGQQNAVLFVLLALFFLLFIIGQITAYQCEIKSEAAI